MNASAHREYSCKTGRRHDGDTRPRDRGVVAIAGLSAWCYSCHCVGCKYRTNRARRSAARFYQTIAVRLARAPWPMPPPGPSTARARKSGGPVRKPISLRPAPTFPRGYVVAFVVPHQHRLPRRLGDLSEPGGTSLVRGSSKLSITMETVRDLVLKTAANRVRVEQRARPNPHGKLDGSALSRAMSFSRPWLGQSQ